MLFSENVKNSPNFYKRNLFMVSWPTIYSKLGDYVFIKLFAIKSIHDNSKVRSYNNIC